MIELNNQVAHSIHCFSPLQKKNSPHAFSPHSQEENDDLVSRNGNKGAGANPKKIIMS